MPMTEKTTEESPRQSGKQLIQSGGVHCTSPCESYYLKLDTGKGSVEGMFRFAHSILNRTKGTEKRVDAEQYLKL
jgi:hypothetical protein